MRLFLSTVILWGITAVLPGRELPSPLITWAWWTSSQYLCAGASWEETYESARDRVMGVAAYTLVATYYIVMQPIYMEFIPLDADRPNLWPTIYMVVNLVLPIGLVIGGLCRGAGPEGEGRMRIETAKMKYAPLIGFLLLSGMAGCYMLVTTDLPKLGRALYRGVDRASGRIAIGRLGSCKASANA